jgi:hypothetical protein
MQTGKGTTRLLLMAPNAAVFAVQRGESARCRCGWAGDVLDAVGDNIDPAFNADFVEFFWTFADLWFQSSFLDRQMISAKLVSKLAAHFKEGCI